MANQGTNLKETNPKVSILIPCRNEVDSICNCLNNICALEEPPGGSEIFVIDGMSDDGTRNKVSEYVKKNPGIRLLDNRLKTVPNAMNTGILEAKGEYIIRADVRCLHPKSYLKDLISLSLESGADNVGGVLVPIGKKYWQKAIAASYRSRISMGGALRHKKAFLGEVDAVYGGCFTRKRLIEVGMYDPSMVRNQDDELSFRLRKMGGKVVQSSKIRVMYYPRKNIKQLFKQFLQYGFWKVFVVRKHPRQGSLRHAIPLMLVVSFLFLALFSFFSAPAFFLFLVLTGMYVCVVSLEAFRTCRSKQARLQPAVTISIATIHFAYGFGALLGVICSIFGIAPQWFETLSR